MSEQVKKSLLQFMKKQISEKSSGKKSGFSFDANLTEGKNEEVDKRSKDEIDEEEQLEEAKKASQNKAAERNQSALMKKLLLENITKYALLITVLAVFAIAIIKCGPVVVGFFNGMIPKILMGALHN